MSTAMTTDERRAALRGVRDTDGALALFDALPAVDVPAMLGSWRGAGVPTGHPLDGLLELFGWHGKRFESADAAHPLVFGDARGRFTVDPAGVPLPLLLRSSAALHDERLATVLRRVLRLRRTRKPKARLRMVEHRGAVTGTMVYDALPVNDHFRAVDDDLLLGVMDARGMATPFVFALHREPAPEA